MIEKRTFGRLRDGRETHLFVLTNKNGMQLKVTDYGATVVSIMAPELQDGIKDMVLGFDDAAGYEKTGLYLGATIGRYAGQIKNASFELNGKIYRLSVNDHENTLHGGKKGFDKCLFDYSIINACNRIEFTYTSPDGEGGFPGTMTVFSKYTLTDENEVRIEFNAVSEQDTVLNMTNHCYYNLDGHDSGSILEHTLMICAEEFLEVGEDCAPNGKILPVENTPMDFRKEHKIGEKIDCDMEQLRICEGYDHNWNVVPYNGKMRLCAKLTGKTGLRALEIYSDLPGLQMYSGNYLNGEETGKDGRRYKYREALCLEPQFYPCAPNYTHFPSSVLRAGEEYKHLIILKFQYKKQGSEEAI